MSRLRVALIFFSLTLAVRGQTNTDCVAHLRDLVEKMTARHQAVTNDPVRLDCLEAKLNKLTSLLELAGKIENDIDSDDAGLAELKIACDRADNIYKTLNDCDNTPVLIKVRKRTPVIDEMPAPPPRGVVIRDETTCLKQLQLAALILDVLDSDPAGLPPIKYLTKQGLEPLGGWKPNRCATVDDLCVLAAGLATITVPAPAEPDGYVRACRQNSLPVDTLLPKRQSDVEPPVVLESEARAFFSRGFAVPLTSSRRVQPD